MSEPKLFASHWIRLLSEERNLFQRMRLFREALSFIPMSYKFISLFTSQFLVALQGQPPNHWLLQEISHLYEDAVLPNLGKFPRIWIFRLKISLLRQSTAETLRILSLALTRVSVLQHRKIWDFLMPWIKGLKNKRLLCLLFEKYLLLDPYFTEQYVDVLIQRGLYQEAAT